MLLYCTHIVKREKLKPAVMYRSCKIKWNHILFLWFRFALTHPMRSYEIHCTKKKRPARFHFVSSWAKFPPIQSSFHIGHHAKSCNVIEMNHSSRKFPKSNKQKKREKKERNTIAEDEFSCQARCCEVTKVSGPRWSPCSRWLEQRIHIRGHVYLGGKQQLSGALRQRGRNRVL